MPHGLFPSANRVKEAKEMSWLARPLRCARTRMLVSTAISGDPPFDR
jgi:hypothetical protein